MAERLGRALQKLLHRFKSGSDLTKIPALRGFFVFGAPEPQVQLSEKNKKAILPKGE